MNRDCDMSHSENRISALRAVTPGDEWELSEKRLTEAVRQLKAYFSGKLQAFDLPLAAEGSDFQRRVWRALRKIPYGTTASYGEIAKSVGNPAAARAVGMANGRNPIAIIVPCHRIIGSSGKLVGYGGGLRRKQTLLNLELQGAEAGEHLQVMSRGYRELQARQRTRR